jgi:hypothetical protein
MVAGLVLLKAAEAKRLDKLVDCERRLFAMEIWSSETKCGD